jgi:hypothetical protein
VTGVGISEWRSLQMTEDRIGLGVPSPDKGGVAGVYCEHCGPRG